MILNFYLDVVEASNSFRRVIKYETKERNKQRFVNLVQLIDIKKKRKLFKYIHVKRCFHIGKRAK